MQRIYFQSLSYKQIIGLILILMTSCISDKSQSTIKNWFFNDDYPIKIDFEKGYQFSDLNISYQNFELYFSSGTFVEIGSDPGITGILINSQGYLIHYNNTLVNRTKYEIKGQLLIRFHPDVYHSIVSKHELILWDATESEKEGWKFIKRHFNFAFADNLKIRIPEKGDYGIVSDNFSIVFISENSNNDVILFGDHTK